MESCLYLAIVEVLVILSVYNTVISWQLWGILLFVLRFKGWIVLLCWLILTSCWLAWVYSAGGRVWGLAVLSNQSEGMVVWVYVSCDRVIVTDCQSEVTKVNYVTAVTTFCHYFIIITCVPYAHMPHAYSHHTPHIHMHTAFNSEEWYKGTWSACSWFMAQYSHLSTQQQ